MKTKFKNIRIGSYREYDTIEARDRRICEENNEKYEPSELQEIVEKYTINNQVKTDFNSLVALSKEINDCYGSSLIIEPNGMLLVYNTDY